MTSEEIFKAKMEATLFIAIDPDSEKSGWALLNTHNRAIAASSRPFPEIASLLNNLNFALAHGEGEGELMEMARGTFIIIEGGWLNESNWHVRGKNVSPAKAAAIGRSVGMNHQTGILIAQMCEAYGLPYEVVKPLPKHWKGKDGKITAEELAYFTGYTKRTNQDERDAILLAWVHAGLPIRVKPIGKDGGE